MYEFSNDYWSNIQYNIYVRGKGKSNSTSINFNKN